MPGGLAGAPPFREAPYADGVLSMGADVVCGSGDKVGATGDAQAPGQSRAIAFEEM